MYCPRCNLHSDEYVEKCPLCDGPMEVDAVGSGVMKTPTIPEGEEPTVELLKDQTLRIVREMEEEEFTRGGTAALERGTLGDQTVSLEEETLADQTVALEGETLAEKTVALERESLGDETGALEREHVAPEGEKELLRIPEPEKKPEEPMAAREEVTYGQEPRAMAGRPERKKPPLMLGGLLVVAVVIALAYFFLVPSEQPSPPKAKKVAIAKKRPVSKKASPVTEKAAVMKPGEITEPKPVEPTKAEGPVVSKKETAPPVAPGQLPAAKKPETPAVAETSQPLKVATREAPSVKPEMPKLPLPLAKTETAAPLTKEAAPSKTEAVPAKQVVEAQKPQPVPSKPEVLVKPPEATKLPVQTSSADTKRVPPEKPVGVIAVLPAPSEQGRYSVHVGSFKLKENADEIVSSLQKKGYPVLCNFVDVPEKGEFYRVKVGYYPSAKEAKRVAAKLKTDEKVSTLVLQR